MPVLCCMHCRAATAVACRCRRRCCRRRCSSMRHRVRPAALTSGLLLPELQAALGSAGIQAGGTVDRDELLAALTRAWGKRAWAACNVK